MKSPFTHYAKFYSIPCYWNNDTNELKGRNWFYDFLLTIAVWIEFEFPTNDNGFPVQLGKKLDDDNQLH